MIGGLRFRQQLQAGYGHLGILDAERGVQEEFEHRLHDGGTRYKVSGMRTSKKYKVNIVPDLAMEEKKGLREERATEV